MTGEKLAGTMLQKKKDLSLIIINHPVGRHNQRLQDTKMLFRDDICGSNQHAPPM
jgi:hypothetical protein